MSDKALVEQPQLPVVGEGPANLLSALVSLATNPDVNPQTVAAWAAIQERMEAREAERVFNEAFHRLSTDLPRVRKNASVEYKGKEAFRFADFQTIDAAIRPLLQREGFNLSFDTAPRVGDGGGIIVTGTLAHVGGHKRTASIPVPLDTSGGKNSVQGYGSALAYGRRYTTMALVNLITDDDDDGQAAGKRYITADQADELRALAKQAGRVEGQLLDRLFSGAVRSFDEVDAGAFVVVKNTLQGIIDQRAKQGQVT
jgi:hypothetical protein